IIINGQPEDICQNGDQVAAASGSFLSRPGLKMPQQILWVSLTYQPLDYLGFSLSWINWAPLYYDDGHTYRQGVVSTNYDAFTTISLGATVSIDGVMNKLIKRKEPLATATAEPALKKSNG